MKNCEVTEPFPIHFVAINCDISIIYYHLCDLSITVQLSTHCMKYVIVCPLLLTFDTVSIIDIPFDDCCSTTVKQPGTDFSRSIINIS